MTHTTDLSARAEALLASPPMAAYTHEHVRRRDRAWTPDRPDGYVGLCVAENRLVFDLLEPRIAACRGTGPDVVAYDRMTGAQGLRERLADVLGRHLLRRRVDPEHVAVLSGASTVLEQVTTLLCDPGDGVLVPTPSYAGFWADLETRAEAVIVPVPRGPEDGWALTPDRLAGAAAGAGRPLKVLLLTNPDNPLGRVAPPEEVRACIDWAHARGMHVVLDEVYALSVHGDVAFTSGAALLPALGERTHLVWAVSKDLAMSGLRVGVLVTEHPRLREALDHLAMWGMASGDTQELLRRMLADDGWLEGFVTESQRRLRAAYTATSEGLAAAGITHVPADAGFFAWVDLRPWLDAPTFEAEERLWRRILDETDVNLTPGSACRAPEPGWFRLVFSCVPTEAVTAALTRLPHPLRPVE